MLRIISSIIVGVMLWIVGFMLNPFYNYESANTIIAILPTVYVIVVSLAVGFIVAIIVNQKRIIVAMMPVLLVLIFYGLRVYAGANKQIIKEGILYFVMFGIVCIISAALGGLIAKLLKIKLPPRNRKTDLLKNVNCNKRFVNRN